MAKEMKTGGGSGIRTSVNPIRPVRSLRPFSSRVLTSLPAGRVVPLVAMPLLREDAVRTGRYRLTFESHETAEMLANPVNVTVCAYLVPHLALDRFDGMDALNRSYEGVAVEGLSVVPFIEPLTWVASGDELHTYLGLHSRVDEEVNSAYIESYNQIWNHRAKNRSLSITQRSRLDRTLAPAFWNHSRYADIVPDFDQAIIDGEVNIQIPGFQAPISGIALTTGVNYTSSGAGFVQANEETPSGGNWSGTGVPTSGMIFKGDNATKIPEIFAELQEQGVNVTLSNIDLARKTAAFAQLRQQYEGIDEDYLIDLLMDGISVPEQAYRQPILLSKKTVPFAMALRYSSTSGALDESAVNGATMVDLTLRVPRITTGGVVMITAEILPEQLFEREKDPYLSALSVDQFPQYLRDTLDPEKVTVVPNEYIDMDHATPDGTFGYAPLNFEWAMQAPRIGGRFYRPDSGAAFDENRQRIWAVEQQDPALTEDFYISSDINTDVFEDTEQDPFEVVVVGDAIIEGNTVFGGRLADSSDSNYDAVAAEVDNTRIDKGA